jgi:hypothetical protein
MGSNISFSYWRTHSLTHSPSRTPINSSYVRGSGFVCVCVRTREKERRTGGRMATTDGVRWRAASKWIWHHAKWAVRFLFLSTSNDVRYQVLEIGFPVMRLACKLHSQSVMVNGATVYLLISHLSKRGIYVKWQIESIKAGCTWDVHRYVCWER